LITKKKRNFFQLRLTLRQCTDELQLKDQEFAALRKKEQSFRSAVDSIQVKLDTEIIKNQDLDGQVRY